MKKKILICFLFLIMSFLNLSNVKAAKYANYDTGTCIDDFGTITFNSGGNDNLMGGYVSFSNKNNNLTWNTNPVTFDVNVMSTANHKVKDIRYSISSKDGYSCNGIISGSAIENNQGSVNLSVVINKGHVEYMNFWGKTVHKNDSTKGDVTESNKINVKREMTQKELEEINKELEIGPGETLKCKTLQNLLDKYWTWVMILAPMATVILITIDFVGPILSGNSAEALKKASDKAVKRAIALVILLMLPVIVNLLFGLFGIETCF